MGQVRHGSATTTHAVRASLQSDPLPGRALRSNVPKGASFARAVEPGTQHQVEDGGEVAEKGDGRGLEDGAVRTAIYGPDRGERNDDRGIPAPYTAAAGRLPLRLAAFGAAPDPLCPASVLATAWHLAPAGCGG